MVSIKKNSVYYFIYNFFNVVFPFITGIYVARILLSENIGQVEIARNFAQYFVILAFLGIPTYGLREISRVRNDRNKTNKVFSELVTINFISTTIFLLLYIILIFIIPSYRKNIVIFLISGISIFLNYFNISWLFEGLEKFKLISIRNCVFKLISFIFLLVFVRTSNDYINYAIITQIGTAGNYLWNVLIAHKYVSFSLKKICLKRHMKSILYLIVVNLAIEIYSLLDITMLGWFCEDKIVTYYSYAMKIHKIIIQLLNTFTIITIPRISFYYQENKTNEFNSLISKVFIIIFMISVPLIIGTFFVSDSVFVAIYGDEYIQSSNVFKILSITFLISPIGYLLGSRILLVTKNENKMVWPVLCGAIINTILNCILINFYEEIGASIASICGELVVLIIYLAISNKYFKLKDVWDSLKKIFVSIVIIIMALLIFNYFDLNFIQVILIEIPVVILIYFLVLIILKEKIVCDSIKFFLKIKK